MDNVFIVIEMRFFKPQLSNEYKGYDTHSSRAQGPAEKPA